MKPTMDDVHVVLARFHESDWDELRIDAGDFRLHVSKSPRSERPAATPITARPDATVPRSAAAGVAPSAMTAGAQPAVAEKGEQEFEGVVVRAPSLGTFYRSPKPGAAPYVEVGAEVTADSQLCLLEVMKLYTAVEAGVAGVVVQVLVDDAALVEHGQPLFVIRPHEE
jgi:acetyl-CoA carboxylase biotin carboxyl carrier protein